MTKRLWSPLAIIALTLLGVQCDNASGPSSPPALLQIVSGDAQSGVVGQQLPNPLVAKVLDADNHPVKGQIVNFKVTSGGGSVFAGAALTNNDGIAQERWTVGTSTADSQRVEVRAVDATTGASQVFAVFKANPSPDAPSRLDKVSGDGQGAVPNTPVGDSLAVKVVDRYGNAVPGSTVDWATTSGTVAPVHATAAASGVAKTAWVLGDPVNEYTATAAGTGMATVTFTASAFGPAATIYKLGNNQAGVIGTALLPLGALVSDIHGNPVVGDTVYWTITSGGGSVSVPWSITGPSATTGPGIADVTWTLGTRLDATFELTGTVTGLPPAHWVARPLAPPVIKLTRTAGENQTAVVGTQLDSLEVTATTPDGQPLPGILLHWNAFGSGTLSDTATLTRADGTSRVSWTLGGIGTWLVRVNALDHSKDTLSFHATATAGPPTGISKAAGDSGVALAGEALADSVAVILFDAHNYPTANIPVSWQVIGGGTVSFGTAMTDGYGRASARWSLGLSGAQQLIATALGGTPGQLQATFVAGFQTPLASISASNSFIEGYLGHTCALTSTGKPYCWGVNEFGQTTGNIPADHNPLPRPVAVNTNLSFIAISANAGHSCALTSGGSAHCWGLNSDGQVGAGVSDSILPVTAVSGGLIFGSIAAGYRSTCALTTTGAAYCWGAFGNSHVPIAVSGGLTFTTLHLGAKRACGVTGTGAGYCWTADLVPDLLQGGPYSSVTSVGGPHYGDPTSDDICGLRTNGAVYCLLLGTPELVTGGPAFTTITHGAFHRCAITSAGAGFCWGYLMLGNGMGSQYSATPQTILGGISFQQLSAGGYYTCGIGASGASYCWGIGPALGNGMNTEGLRPVLIKITDAF